LDCKAVAVLRLDAAVDLMKFLGFMGRLLPSLCSAFGGERVWVLDWLCEGKEERRGKVERDLRARTDCFNRQIWLDESASEWGRRSEDFAAPKWLAGSIDEGRVRSEDVLGVSLQESARCGDVLKT